MPPSPKRQWAGIGIALAAVVGIDAGATMGLPIGDPGGLYLLIVLAATLASGLYAGLVSAGLIVGYLAAVPYIQASAFAGFTWDERHVIGHAILLPAAALIIGLTQIALRGTALRAYDAQLAAAREAEQRAKAELELESSENLRHLVVESALDAVIAMRQDGTITLWNAAAEEMFGWKEEEAIGQELAKTVIPPESRSAHRQGLRRFLETGEGPILGARLELIAMRRDGSEFPVELAVTPHETREGWMFVGFVHDLTDRKAAEAAIRELNLTLEQRVAERTAELETVNKELEAFSHSVSHDLRSPLRSIDGFSQILLEDYSETLDDQAKEYLERVRLASQRMAQLIDDLLNLSRVSRSEMKREKVSLSRKVQAISTEIKASNPGRRVKWVIGKGISAYGDRRLLRVALQNLIDNAFKFTSKNEGQAVIEFGAVNRDLEPVYYVRDNGAGFDMAHAGKLFGTFQRLHGMTEFEGTGVGLATVQRIVERHGGKVWAEGEVGKGATFYFTLPFHLESLKTDEPEFEP